MYNPAVQYPQNPNAYGQPTPQGGNMPITAGATGPMAPGPAGGTPAGGLGAIGQLDPALIAQILALQSQDPQQRAVARQRSLADQLRGDAAGQLTPSKYSRPGWANVGAAVLNGYAAKKFGQDADVREMNLGAQRQGALESYFDALNGRKRGPLPHMGDEGE